MEPVERDNKIKNDLYISKKAKMYLIENVNFEITIDEEYFRKRDIWLNEIIKNLHKNKELFTLSKFFNCIFVERDCVCNSKIIHRLNYFHKVIDFNLCFEIYDTSIILKVNNLIIFENEVYNFKNFRLFYKNFLNFLKQDLSNAYLSDLNSDLN
jgi:hypothetical protein